MPVSVETNHIKSNMPSEENYKLIEGEWKEFRFRRIRPVDKAAVFEHLSNNYTQDEQVEKMLGWSQEMADDVNKVVDYCLKDGLSFWAEHVPTGKVAGVRITFKRTPDFPPLESFQSKTRSARLFFKFIEDLEGRGDLPGSRGLDYWAGFFAASTDRSFRNIGLAGEFYNRSCAFLKAEGFKHALVITTSPWTGKATQNRDFEIIARIEFSELVDYEGKPMFNVAELDPQRHFALLKLKTL